MVYKLSYMGEASAEPDAANQDVMYVVPGFPRLK